MKGSRLVIVLLAIIATTGVVAMTAKSGSDFDISWFSIDSGGGSSDREIWEVTGTMGQPDAGAPLSGGPWTVTGGFSIEIAEGGGGFRRGDCNADDSTNIADAIFLLSFISGMGDDPPCEESCNANNDSSSNIADVIYIFSYIAGIGTEPLPPFPACGMDPVTLGCVSFPPCP